MMWFALSFACTQKELIQIIHQSERQKQALSFFVEGLEKDERVLLSTQEEPLRSDAFQVYLFEDEQGAESYRLSASSRTDVEIHGSDILGVQYGLAHYLEKQGYRFYHPYNTKVPDTLSYIEADEDFDTLHSPQMERRGIHLHTLHPIEGYYDFWEIDDPMRAQRVGSWIIKNRGNYIEWVGLDDITDNPIKLAGWQEDTANVVENLHIQGLEVGLGVQIYGSGNLQNAYDLIDQPNGDIEEQIKARLRPILEVAEFDVLEISFGEFFGEDPQRFIDTLDKTHEVARAIDPDIETTARIHVGADLEIEYQGQSMIYYFLAQFAHPDIVPWVHTVMYYNLFEPANGAYHHDDFQAHQSFLFARLEQGLPVAYFPESAYWVAFDNSVPTYLPLYIRSRWTDLELIHKEVMQRGYPSLQQHILFSSGWEWGYWQNDVATLRMNWKLEDSYLNTLQEMFAPYTDQIDVAQIIYEIAELQHHYLIELKLDRYMCGVDNIMELGYGADIISQPRRMSFSEMADQEASQLRDIVTQLRTFAQEHESRRVNIDNPDIWLRELDEGLAITALRARFMAALIEAIADSSTNLSLAEDYKAQAQRITQSRSEQAHDPNMARLISENDNATIYQFGYLYRAHELCYWERELIQVQNLLLGSNEIPPGCGI